MSMYARYLTERTQDHILETEQGFATYRFTDEKTCYIVDIFVEKDFRKSGVASDIADQIVGIAKKRGCTSLLGTVVPSARGSTASLKVLLGYGMSLDSSGPDFIVFRKDI